MILLALTSWSCEKIIDIDLPETERKMVVNGLITPDSLVTVNLTKSLSVLEVDSFIFVPDARVTLSLGEEIIGELSYQDKGDYILPGYYPGMGNTYRLDIEVPDLQAAYAETTIPESTMLQAVDTSWVTDEWGEQVLYLNLQFEDQPDQDNYYGLVVYATSKEFDFLTGEFTGNKETHTVYIGRTDPILEEEGLFFGERLLFNDLTFQGKSKSIEFELYDYAFYTSDTVWLDVRLEEIEEDYYLYALSSEKYSATFRNPFSEPVQVYNNIEGGFGLFSSYSSDSWLITVVNIKL